MQKEVTIKIQETEVVFYQTGSKETRWSFRIGGGYYNINYLTLPDAMEYAKNVLIGNLIKTCDREIKKVKRKNIK